MRRFLISLMAASMFVPVAAQAEDGAVERSIRSHAERSSKNDNRSDNGSSRAQSQRSERSNDDRPVRIERAPRSERSPEVERAVRVNDVDRGVRRIERADGEDRGVRRIDRVRRADRDVQRTEPVAATDPAQSTQPTQRRYDGLAGAFSRAGRDMADGRTSDRDGDRDWRRDRDGDGDRDWRRDRDRDGDRDWRRDRDGRHDWRRDWRRDRRYDWSSYRHRYGSLFRLGRYYDPYGWGYRRFSIGFNLWPSYYGSSFWLNDPWQYRLPPAYGPYRWIRYYDDALLVNIYTGQVVDVEHNVFW
jgi:hypothetical protein